MVYRGHFRDGVIVPDEPIAIENGASVVFEVKVDSPEQGGDACAAEAPSVTQLLSRFAGRATSLPEDAAENHDHYLYGVPKK